MPSKMDDTGRAARAIASADHLLISAGAGMGVDSGLPDFRGNEGFWKEYPPYKDKGLSFINMANPRWFAMKPEIGWGFYGHRLRLYRDTVPHDGFQILLRWASRMKSYFVFTSNVDGQFQKAGFATDRVYEVHGSIHHLQCSVPCCDDVFPADVDVEVDTRTMMAAPPLPSCPHCGDLARPNVLMFGDFSYTSRREHGSRREYQTWQSEVGEEELVIVEIGAGTAVPTVRLEGESLVRRMGATLIRINPGEDQGGGACIAMRKSGLDALADLDQALESIR